MLDVRRTLAVLACTLLVLPAACADNDADDVDDFATADTLARDTARDQEPEGFGGVRDDYLAAWNGDNPAEVTNFFTENATARVDGQTHTGRDAIRTGWVQEAMTRVDDLEVERTRGERRGNDWYEEGTYRFELDDDAPADTTAGRPMSTSGRYTVTWTREADGRWRIRSTEVTADTTAAQRR